MPLSIIRELSERAELDRKWSSEVTEGLKNDILGVREFCFNLSEQIQSHQSAAQWQDKFSKAQMDHQALLQETDRLKEELAGMHIEADTQRQQRETLQQQLNSLSASAKITDASNKLIETLQKEKQRIQEGLNEKESLIRTLEEKLREVTEALSVQKSQFKDQECRFQYDRAKFMETIASCHEQRDQAINQAREEYTRIQTKYHDVENRLRNAEQNYSQLQIEVVQAKQGAEHTLRKNKDEVAKQAQQLLVPIADLIEKTSEGLQTSEQVNDNLNKKLEAWSQDHVEVSLLRQAFQKLAKDYKTNTENGKILVNFLEVQKEMENTWRWHKSEVNALNRAIELEKGVMADTEGAIHIGHKGQPNISHVIHRRVMIQSPAIDHDRNRKMTPVSIEEERVTRRQAAPVKGIMKPAALQRQEKMEEQHHQKDQTTAQTGQSLSRRQATSTDEKKSILVSHSAYNRPVLGSAASLEECNIDCMPEEIETASTEVPVSKKRQRVEMESNEREKAVDKISHAAHKRRVKISRSMST
ncbi:hypothetical protein RRF57_002129 [Xylaria bambusicola]|uniref:Uncharacterized protein n=1 Tax=Xylaria bambusicola TaxID=326684 RepID=A0AAN7UIE2_9PEZI